MVLNPINNGFHVVNPVDSITRVQGLLYLGGRYWPITVLCFSHATCDGQEADNAKLKSLLKCLVVLVNGLLSTLEYLKYKQMYRVASGLR